MKPDENSIQENPKGNENKSQSLTIQDRASRRYWLPMAVFYYNEAFEKRCRELIAFKEEFGHCNIPQKCANNPSLGHWCDKMRGAYKKIQKGMKPNSNLSQDRIERLDEIGFQ